MVLIVKEDGSGESALAQAVAQHRSGFCADYDLQAGAEFADTAPPPAECCSELGAEPPRKRSAFMRTVDAAVLCARKPRAIGAYCVIVVVASCCAVVPLVWHLQAKEAAKPTKPVSLGVWG